LLAIHGSMDGTFSHLFALTLLWATTAHASHHGPGPVRTLPPFEQRFPACSYELLKQGDLESLIAAANQSPIDFIVGLAYGDFKISDADFRRFSSGLVSRNNQGVLELCIRIQDMLPAPKKRLLTQMLAFRKKGLGDSIETRQGLLDYLRLLKREIRELTDDYNTREAVRVKVLSAITTATTVDKMFAWETPEQKTDTAKTVRILNRLERDWAKYLNGAFSNDELLQIGQAREHWKSLRTHLFGGHNELLGKIFVSGLPFVQMRPSHLINIVAEEIWNARLWWYHSFGGQRGPGDPPRLTKITGATSRSPLRKILGPKSERRISWSAYDPYRYPTSAMELDLDRIRIATNYAVVGRKRIAKSLEVMVRQDTTWKGFYFERVNGEWLPSRTFDGQPIETACMRCHASEKSPGELSPRPLFLKSKEDFKKVGYLNEALIERLLEY
jgi:hypothetical protein